MHDAMAGLDAWLEAPYVNRARDEADFEAWCEREDVDPEAPTAWDDFEQAMENAREDAEITAAEARMEARMEREREDYW